MRVAGFDNKILLSKESTTIILELDISLGTAFPHPQVESIKNINIKQVRSCLLLRVRCFKFLNIEKIQTGFLWIVPGS